MVLIKVVILNNYLVYLKTTNSFLYKRKRNERCEICGINPLASPSAGAPALKYGDVNTVTLSPGEVNGLIKILVKHFIVYF